MKYTNTEIFNNHFLISLKNEEINEELDIIFDKLVERIVMRYTVHPNLRKMYMWYCKKDIEKNWKKYNMYAKNAQPFDYFKVLIQKQVNVLFDCNLQEYKDKYKYETVMKPRILKIEKIRNATLYK